jgi:hypothetical protein
MRLSSGRRAPHLIALMRPMRAVQLFSGAYLPHRSIATQAGMHPARLHQFGLIE